MTRVRAALHYMRQNDGDAMVLLVCCIAVLAYLSGFLQ